MTVPRTLLDLKIGDVVPAAPAGPGLILDPGRPDRWYALTTRPQCEAKAEAWLEKRGIYAFHPVLERTTVVRGRRRTTVSRYVPGFVFARFPGLPRAHEVTAGPFIIDALRDSHGGWGKLNPDGLRRLHSMRRMDQAAEDRRRRAAIRFAERNRLKAGDTALFRAGPFAGFHCEVVHLPAAGGLSVRLEIFGREMQTEVDECDLVRVDRAKRD
ncbi:transcription termination/antitermination protein NusG [Wenxinia saemankumensis]|uniref:Transcription antitermination factor NusG n=1 Tax=Wenxinia saemankumensis TaxID=1447782 RepID=A0A1M6EZC2_9RHOB|nr:transcription termination/antitermination NusG family protein [Wenxinia saemankumensis]SHI90780.1 Transcription antitermination factor NusG [Wenxinia saemankumensis]